MLRLRVLSSPSWRTALSRGLMRMRSWQLVKSTRLLLHSWLSGCVIVREGDNNTVCWRSTGFQEHTLQFWYCWLIHKKDGNSNRNVTLLLTLLFPKTESIISSTENTPPICLYSLFSCADVLPFYLDHNQHVLSLWNNSITHPAICGTSTWEMLVLFSQEKQEMIL